MHKTLAFVVSSLLLIPAAQAARTPHVAPVSLVQNEYDFAAEVAKHGIRDGFLKYLDKQSITFGPQPINAFDRYSQGKASKTQLLWYPSYALVSASGDFGVDTGPWTAHWEEEGKQQTAYGEWLSIWAKDSTGTWKALFDAGTGHDAEDKAKPLAPHSKVAQLPAVSGPVASVDDLHDAMMRADTVFSNDAINKGLRAAYENSGTDDIRVLMLGGQPLLGKAEMAKVVPDALSDLQWFPMGGSVAKSGDLGYLYGMTYKTGDTAHLTPQGTYMHVWRKGVDGWKLLIAEELPLPASAGK